MTSYPALRELAEKAVSGSWKALGATTHHGPWIIAESGSKIAGPDDGPDTANGDFIAAANPTAILDILDKYDAALAEIDRLKEALTSIKGKALQMAADPMQVNRGLWQACADEANAALTSPETPSQALRSTP